MGGRKNRESELVELEEGIRKACRYLKIKGINRMGWRKWN
jgi:hypothetical protein